MVLKWILIGSTRDGATRLLRGHQPPPTRNASHADGPTPRARDGTDWKKGEVERLL